MVSGLVTSPWDQLRIFSGEARLMRIASKSAILLAMSKGLERYKVSSGAILRREVPEIGKTVKTVVRERFKMAPPLASHIPSAD